MKLNSNRLGYYIKEGFISIFTHSLMSFASVCIIVAFLVIMGGFSLLALNINALVGKLENENVLLAYVDESYSEQDARDLRQSLRVLPNVSSVNFISVNQAMESFLGRYEDNSRYEDVKPDWFRHRFEIHVNDVALLAQTQIDVSEVHGIVKVNANLTIAKGLVTVRNIVSRVSIGMVSILLAISVFIMSNTIKLSTYERREEIAIMKMVGATNGFIRWPFILEGFLLGTIGSIAAFASIWGLYGLVSNSIMDIGIGFISVLPFTSVSFRMFMMFVSIGFGVGVGGSGMVLNRYLNV
ncbi:MAG: permease-like cell division protein FtsX [Oscillospiraceae bacterium]|nr:permease-like cell division protein FtsX [Oscillospiraceae bacterium]